MNKILTKVNKNYQNSNEIQRKFTKL